MIEINLSVNSKKNKVIVDGKEITDKVVGIELLKTKEIFPIINLQLTDNEINITGDSALIIKDKKLDDYSTNELIKEIFSRKIKKAE